MIQKKLLYILTIAIFLSTSSNVFAKEKLIFAIDLIRHGDRTPEYEIPGSPYSWKEGLGQLTAKGISQETQLGKELRKKYVNQYYLLPKSYNPETIYVRSTDYNRTQMSANSLLLGLYPIKMRASFSQKIPIHVVSNDDDNLLVVKPSRNIFSLISRYLADRKA